MSQKEMAMAVLVIGLAVGLVSHCVVYYISRKKGSE